MVFEFKMDYLMIFEMEMDYLMNFEVKNGLFDEF